MTRLIIPSKPSPCLPLRGYQSSTVSPVVTPGGIGMAAHAISSSMVKEHSSNNSRYLNHPSSKMTGIIISAIRFLVKISVCVYVIGWSMVMAEKEPVEESKVAPTGATMGPSTEHGNATSGVGFFHAFLASISVIIVSELGDKTFFIAAIMAMRHPRLTVFLAAITALAAMTVISVGFGWLTTYIPRAYTYYVSTALFALFGLKMLKDGYYMSASKGQEELEEVQTDLRKREDEFEKESILNGDPESGRRTKTKPSGMSLMTRVFLQAFTLTFLAEWGDRSQLTTIILAAREDLYGVIIGGCLGHALCTGLAVIGGRMIAQKISVRTVTIIGGIVFLIFAVTSLFSYPSDEG